MEKHPPARQRGFVGRRLPIHFPEKICCLIQVMAERQYQRVVSLLPLTDDTRDYLVRQRNRIAVSGMGSAGEEREGQQSCTDGKPSSAYGHNRHGHTKFSAD